MGCVGYSSGVQAGSMGLFPLACGQMPSVRVSVGPSGDQVRECDPQSAPCLLPPVRCHPARGWRLNSRTCPGLFQTWHGHSMKAPIGEKWELGAVRTEEDGGEKEVCERWIGASLEVQGLVGRDPHHGKVSAGSRKPWDFQPPQSLRPTCEWWLSSL